MLRPALPRIGRSLRIGQSNRIFRRTLIHVPTLTAESFKDGVPGLLSPAAFDMAWTQYQTLMIEKLNGLVAGTEDASKDIKPILIKHARDPNSAPIFNYASMAWNNHFFFKGLSPNPQPIPTRLLKDLEPSFPSLETLRREFILTANAMFGPGFVWLVKDKSSRYHVLTTYLAGSPWPAAHYRRQNTDMNTEDEDMRRIQRGPAVNAKTGAHGHPREVGPGGAEIIPVLCLNTWEHVYLPDYGVGAGGIGGKKAYAEAWWETIDWNFVCENALPISKNSQYLS